MKLQLSLIVWVLGMSPSFAWAMTNLKQVEVAEGSRVELSFDGKIFPGQIKTEYFNDIIQLTMTDVSVYPARIFSVNSGEITKIFAYQYGPKVVRCRITVKGKAESYKNRIQTIQYAKQYAIKIKNSDEIQSVSAKAVSAVKPEAEDDGDEKVLLDKILKSEKSDTAGTIEKQEITRPKKGSAETTGVAAVTQMAALGADSIENTPLKMPVSNAKPVAGFMRTIIALLGVISIFGGLALGVRWLMKNSKGKNKLLTALSSKLSKAGLTKKAKMIEVVATHHLGPKKSIAMVRIGGKTLVLGVGQDSINLITTLGANGESEGDSAVSDLFESNLDQAVTQSFIQSVAPRAPEVKRENAVEATGYTNVRAQIRTRLEGLKQL